jgi:hypothetical protein
MIQVFLSDPSTVIALLGLILEVIRFARELYQDKKG